MKITKIIPMIVGLLMIGSLAGCALFNKTEMHSTRTTTIGKELIDLKEARDSGAVSEEEYNKLKKEIMKGGPHDVEIGYRFESGV